MAASWWSSGTILCSHCHGLDLSYREITQLYCVSTGPKLGANGGRGDTQQQSCRSCYTCVEEANEIIS